MSPSSDNASVRLFFALWPDSAEQARLAEWQPPLLELAGGRAMRSDTLHTTLVFLGDVARDRLEALQLAALEVDAERFVLHLDHAGYWGHNHIIHASPSRIPERLSHLVEMLEQHLCRHHFEFERRAYKPHVTLLRNTHWTDRPLPTMRPVSWQAGDFALVQSRPEQGLARYSVLARFPLRTSEA